MGTTILFNLLAPLQTGYNISKKLLADFSFPKTSPAISTFPNRIIVSYDASTKNNFTFLNQLFSFGRIVRHAVNDFCDSFRIALWTLCWFTVEFNPFACTHLQTPLQFPQGIPPFFFTSSSDIGIQFLHVLTELQVGQ